MTAYWRSTSNMLQRENLEDFLVVRNLSNPTSWTTHNFLLIQYGIYL